MDIKNEFSWSQSRSKLFDDCKRKYFYQYYGSWGGWSFTSDRRTREIYIQKNLQTLPMFIGDSVHKVIEEYLNEVRKGRDMPLTSLIRQFRGFMDHGLQESKEGKNKLNPKKYRGLLEHQYGEISSSAWNAAILSGEQSLKNFYESQVLKDLKASDKNSWLPIEQFQDFSLDGTTVFVKIDFAMKEGDKVIIYDWKTGKTESDDNTQLACYALYASKKWNVQLPVVTKEYNLYLNKVRETTVIQKDIDEVEEVIKKSIKEMKSLLFNENSNLAKEDDFPLNRGDWCTYCKFKKVCFDEWTK